MMYDGCVCLGVPEPVQRTEIWLDDAHWWLTQKDGQLEIADISITNFRYVLMFPYCIQYTHFGEQHPKKTVSFTV